MVVIIHHLPTIIMLVVAVAYAESKPYNRTLRREKGPRCHHPLMAEHCNNALFKYLNYTLAGWFYDSLFRVCNPIFTATGTHECPENQDLPLTKEECEEKCGEPCKDAFGIDGVCMMDDYCNPKVSIVVPRPCLAYNVNCCPWSVPSTTTEPILEKIPSNASHIQSNTSMYN